MKLKFEKSLELDQQIQIFNSQPHPDKKKNRRPPVDSRYVSSKAGDLKRINTNNEHVNSFNDSEAETRRRPQIVTDYEI